MEIETPPRVGFTTTIPVEVLLAGGRVPVDLNNVFIGAGNPAEYVRHAEADGFPRNSCGWIKGIYGIVRLLGFLGFGPLFDDGPALLRAQFGQCTVTGARCVALLGR